MQRPLAVLLILIGIIGLVLGRLGETTWAPETETTASVTLDNPGSAVVIDPGVLYVGGEEGQVVIEGASDVSVIDAANGDIDAYLEGVHYTRITGASDWTTLSTQDVNPDGAGELSDPTTSDLWRSVETTPSPATIDVAALWAKENGENGESPQPYRSLLIVTDGTAPGADKVSITWPVEAENEWVPFAYAGGATIAVIGLVLLVVSLGGRRRDEDEDWNVEDGEPVEPGESLEPGDPVEPHHAAPVLSGAAAGGGAAAATARSDESAAADAAPAGAAPAEDVPADAAPADEAVVSSATPGSDSAREESVWSLGTPSVDDTPGSDDAHTADDAPDSADAPITEEAPSAADAPGAEDDHSDPAGPVRLFGDDEERR
ncbi:hypothetical protein GCM10023160_20120 [Brachybacterium paraconglomeratum]|uniref:hypothetical protein n=1 Tax=Brachybacterium paraconglomeratum TaxID=173362 RepID=UPI0031EF89F5